MTNAPTTRETADHAELLAKLKTNDPTNPAHRLARDLQAGHRLGTEAGNDLIEVLSEIAALRGEVERVQRECDEMALHGFQAVQAEGQRDELRKALEEIADEAPYRSGYCQSDVEYGPALSADEMQAVARQALANQGAE